MQEAEVSRRSVIGSAIALGLPGAAIAQPSSVSRSILGRRDGQWLNPPKVWNSDAAGDLTIVTDKATDFWRETHYGFTRHSGHFLGFATPAAFTAQVRI